METLVTIRDVLEASQVYRGWLYLPVKPWKLDTQGVFVEFSKDAEPGADELPEVVKSNRWHEVLDAAGIEDIVANAREQLQSATIDDLFRAFTFYTENDAFLEF